MVVIVIIGLAATAVVLAIPEGAGVEREAERFAARAKAARDSAILEARPALVEAGPGGYRIARRRNGEWQEVARREWPEGIEAGAARTRFDTTGGAEPAELELRRGQRRAAVAILADGSIHVRR